MASTLAERISLIKSFYGLKDKELGEIAELSAQGIANIENGLTVNPKISVFGNISNRLGINLDWLVNGEGESGMSLENRGSINIKNRGNTKSNVNKLNFTGNSESPDAELALRFLKEQADELKKQIERLTKENEELRERNEKLFNKLFDNLK